MKFLHTMLRIGNIERSLHFYCDVLGFKVLKKSEFPEGKFTLIFLAAPGDTNPDSPTLELTYNWGVEKYELGDSYGHLAYEVESVEKLQQKLKSFGFDYSWGPGKTPSGKRGMAFLTDPDGYKIELLESDK